MAAPPAPSTFCSYEVDMYPKVTRELIAEINRCTELLNDKGYESVDPLHAVACRSNTARIELISELLDTDQDT